MLKECENKRSGGERSETGFCENKRSAFSQSEKCFLENKRSGDTHEVRGVFLAEQSEAEQSQNGVRVSINGISHGCGGGEVVGGVRKNGDCVVGHAVGGCEIGGAVGLQNANLRVSENGIIQGGVAVMDAGVSANLHSRNATTLNNTISHGVGGANLDNDSLNTGDCSASASPTQEMTAEPPVRSFSQNFVCFVPNDTRNDNRDGSVVGRGVVGGNGSGGASMSVGGASYSENPNSCVSGVGGANLQGRGESGLVGDCGSVGYSVGDCGSVGGNGSGGANPSENIFLCGKNEEIVGEMTRENFATSKGINFSAHSVVGGASYSENPNSCVSGVGGANLQGRGAILQICTV